jgi:hypothetical protein
VYMDGCLVGEITAPAHTGYSMDSAGVRQRAGAGVGWSDSVGVAR